jgi:sucrose-phosphate synthase
MFICHVALQGCLTLRDVPYGLTADTGGHIKYLLELAETSAKDPAVERIDLVTRGFVDPKLGAQYEPDVGEMSGKLRLVRLDDGEASYLPKEELHERHDPLCDAFLAYLENLDRLPDLIHAHYADAGVLARSAKEMLGIPYVFTGHSLGAVKRQANGGGDKELERRIAIEENALAKPDAVIASSRDEAEAQYAHYRSIEAGRIRVIPPGCELDRFEGAAPSTKVQQDVERFLREPSKPIILAIARPVRKKNLLGLVEAYAGDPELQERANLVVVAGCRDKLSRLEPECREVCEELIRAVDAYDLYGKVAYPKAHEPDDIPAYYALARESGGVFVNPALNEPFGLTLLEAAAARLPVVATDSGGPNDIVERCKNGLLVCPRDPQAIAQACKDVISNRRIWIRYASAGGDAVAAYDWKAHCRIYHRLIEEIAKPRTSSGYFERLLVCDIDNTLLGDRDALREFLDWQRQNSSSTALGIATGRSFHSAQSILAAEAVPTPDVIISNVGAQVHWYDREKRRFVEDREWAKRVSRNWDRETVEQVAASLGLRTQAALEQRIGKASYFLDGHDPEKIANAFRDAEVAVEVVSSHGLYLDILASGIGKHAAVLHVADRLGMTQAKVVVAGDSGNDRAMLRACPRPIIVGNWSDGLGDDPALSHAYKASATHAAGILEGVQHYRDAGGW